MNHWCSQDKIWKIISTNLDHFLTVQIPKDDLRKLPGQHKARIQYGFLTIQSIYKRPCLVDWILQLDDPKPPWNTFFGCSVFLYRPHTHDVFFVSIDLWILELLCRSCWFLFDADLGVLSYLCLTLSFENKPLLHNLHVRIILSTYYLPFLMHLSMS